MRFDLAFHLVDIPENISTEWYQIAAGMMLESARHAFRGHDVRLVQLSDGASRMVSGTNIRFTTTAKCDRAELMQYRGHLTAEWALQADRPVVFTDVDVLWNNDQLLQMFEPVGNLPAPDITLFSRQNIFQPFNGGLIMTQPGQQKFWEAYREMMKGLPNDVRPWWGDQIGLAVMCGTPEPGKNGAVRFGSKVAYVPIDLVAPSPKSKPTELLTTSAVHWKGTKKRKPWMPEYFEMLQRNWSKREAAE